MEKIDIINNFFRFIFINLCICAIFFKLINYKITTINKIIILIFSIVFSFVYIILNKYINNTILLLILYLVDAFLLSYMINEKLNYTIIPTAFSFSITYLIYIFSIILDGIIVYKCEIKHNSHLNLILIFIIETIIILCLFKVKRLKKGFYFLKNTDKIIKLGKFSLFFYLIVILIYGVLHIYEDRNINTIMFFVSIIFAICLIIWIRDEIINRYKENMKNRTIELQKIEINEKIKEVNELKENNLKLSTVIHKYNNRLSALEKAVVKTLNNNLNTEFASELTKSLENIKEMSKEFSKEVIDSTNKKKKLPKTNIQSIDNIFEYMQEEAINENINFDLKINSSINYLIENIIDVKDFETLIGDHIRDAIIAINSEKAKNRNIMCILGIVENCYEFSIYDTGIEFEIDTLLNLGLKHITTHSETGGTGIGFMTSFKTLNKCKGSLIIEEYCKETNIYTKCVTFRFDSKGEYRIYSYRSDQIKLKMKDKNRIKVKQI